MSSRKPSLFSLPRITLFYLPLIVLASIAVGMVIASRLDLTPASSAQSIVVPPMNSAPLVGPLSADTFRNIAKAQEPMVVNIRVEMKAKAQDLEGILGGGDSDDLLRRFFGGQNGGQGPGDNNQGGGSRRRQRDPIAKAAGTGFIINSRDGFILTNNHVVDDATKIEVFLYADDDKETPYLAKVIGKDALTDSALIQLVDKPKTPLAEAKFGDSSQMQPGDWVMAIGNPFNYAHTVTVGVISATKRPPFPEADNRSSKLLQTDAAINPGNSGGPLLNIRGEVIGINTAIISNGQSEGNIGIGFAVPINVVRDLLPQLREGRVVRGRIGVEVRPVSRDNFAEYGLKSRTGALVTRVLPGPAAKAGMEPGDVITEFNGRPVPSNNDLVDMVVATKPGTSVPFKILRDKQEKMLTVTVEQLDLNAETQTAQARRGNNQREDNAETQGSGFGLSLRDLTPSVARRLQMPSGRAGALVADVDPDGPAAMSGLSPGDVILSVNRKPVSTAADAAKELQAIASGRLAQIRLWRMDGSGSGSEVFVAVKKD